MNWLTSRTSIKVIFQGDLPRNLHAGLFCLQFHKEEKRKTPEFTYYMKLNYISR